MNRAASHKRPVLIMAGGTGGHVFPALAVADELTALDVPVSWLGTPRGLEARLVPVAGYPLSLIRVSGLRGKGLRRLLLAPFMLTYALLQALVVLLRVRPMAVLGMGGFTAGPGGLVAWLLRRPLLIHEQNSVSGTTNRLLAPLATRVLEAFPGSLPGKYRPLHTGNPVRAEITRLPGPAARQHDASEPLHVLVIGGSLGAQVLNSTVPQAVARVTASMPLQVHHQTGTADEQAVRECYTDAACEARVDAFIDDMAAAYAWADLVVCRAGAMTVSELAVVGLPSILVPFPFATDDHQSGNAAYLSDAGAAVLVPQSQLTVELLGEQLQRLARDREALLAMADKARRLAHPDAARQVARLCLEVAA